MAGNVVNPTTGEKGSVSDEKVNRARAAGARRMTDEEASLTVEQEKHDKNIIEPMIAERVGRVRGIGEAFGLPTDQLATTVGGQETKDYLSDLQKYHPIESGLGELSGQVGGGIAAGEMLGGEFAASKAGSLVSKLPGLATRGALENVIIGSTSDVNEAALGNPDAAGEKILPRLLTHAGVGAVGGMLGGTIGHGIEMGLGAMASKAAPALESAADRAIGKEFGGGAQLGAEIRAKVGGVPRTASEVRTALLAEQNAFREASKLDAAAAKETLAAQQTTKAWEQAARQEAERLKLARESKGAIEELVSQNAKAREALNIQHGEAASAAIKLGEERAAARGRLKNLASELDKVKGATMPEARNITKAAAEVFGGSLTPASPQAKQLFSEWVDSFTKRFSEPGSLTFRELDGAIRSLEVMETRQKVVSGWGSDPEVKRAFEALRNAAKSEFDRASEATANSVSEASGLSASRLRENIPNLDKAFRAAQDNVDAIQQSILGFEKKAQQEIRIAQREAIREGKLFEKGVREEDRVLDKSQRAEEKSLPKPGKETPVDTLLGRVSQSKEEAKFSPLVMGGALVSLLHGNVAGAVMGGLGAFAASTAKAQGNLVAARTLHAIAEHIASADKDIYKLAGRAVGRYVRQGGEQVLDDRPKRKEITFEKAAKQVRDAQANPLILEARVRNAAGEWAKDAPSVYQSMLAAAQRQQEFLSSKLPPSRVDPYSLTPHLEVDDLSDTEKYDFVQYAKAAQDPIAAMKDVVDGNGSPQQVEAVAAIYPRIYEQTKLEVSRRLAELQSPLEYERQVNIGTLLQIDTSEVMTGEFQSMLSDMYSAREKAEEVPGGSKPLGVNSRLSKSMASAGQLMGTTGEG